MKLDFHTHGKLAKRLPFSTQYTDWLLKEAKNSGLDAICLTEHFNTMQFDELYGYISTTAKRDGDTFITKNGLRIFPGMETDIAEGGHILALGPVETILELNLRLAPYKNPDHFLPFKELMDLFEKYDVIVGAAHPFREGGHIPELPEDQLRRLDFIDLNGKDVSENPDVIKELTYSLADRIQKPVLSGSDTHQATQYGCIYTEFTSEINSFAELANEITSNCYDIFISKNAAFQVRTARILKQALKEIHAMGGDYVGILLSDEEEEDTPSFVGRTTVIHKTIIIDYSLKADEMAEKIRLAADEMALKGFELVSVTATASAKGIMVFRKKGL